MKLCLFVPKVCMHRLTGTDWGMCYCLFRAAWKGGVLISLWQQGNCWEGSRRIGKVKCRLESGILRQPHDFIWTCHTPSHYFGQKHSQGKAVVWALDATPTHTSRYMNFSLYPNKWIHKNKTHTHTNCKPQWCRLVNAGTSRISGQSAVPLVMHTSANNLPVLITRNF